MGGHSKKAGRFGTYNHAHLHCNVKNMGQRKKEFKQRKNKSNNTISKKKNMKTWTYLVDIAANSTTHGFNNVFLANIHWVERLFWIGAFNSAVVIMMFLSKPIYERYKTSPTVLSVEMDYYDWNISFPAITLCSPEKVDLNRLERLVRSYNTTDHRNLTSFISAISLTNIDNMGLYFMKDHDLVPPEDYAKISAAVFKNYNELQLTSNTNQPVSRNAIMTHMGMCDIINSNVAHYDMPVYWQGKKPKYEKNNIELNVHDGIFFIQTFNYSESVTLFIHNPDDVFESTTLRYSQAEHTFIYLTLFTKNTKASADVKYLSPSQRNCRYIDEPVSSRDGIYSYNRCIKECRIRISLKLCGCIPHFYKPIDGEKVCAMSQLSCLARYKTAFKHLTVTEEEKLKSPNLSDLPGSVKDCGCLQNCEEYTYLKSSIEISKSKYTMLRVGIEMYPKVRYSREILFGFYDFLVRTGGVMNLCLGMSVISVIENAANFIKFLVYAFMRLINTKLVSRFLDWL